jgi:hypothetical protein
VEDPATDLVGKESLGEDESIGLGGIWRGFMLPSNISITLLIVGLNAP